ncbi:ATPase, T2SS/T4P/T4SS family [Paenibacillus lutrae]|uniref:Bacterial type II secretion system protein E domain-containing protein n=1 Tax=Paenibacillus lutrae TaxID=2078573 RepID=A0A7X3FLU0_9BACL|nr:ATPase, T2SS/T4P/T4SS family [Paenibacillus lutrae]MVP02129.1 hypothetical protein [Paenibacillus lutrae]
MFNQPPFSLKARIQKNQSYSNTNFYDYIRVMREDMTRNLERQDSAYLKLNSNALLGDPVSVSYFMNEIEKYQRTKLYSGELPEVYQNRTEAIYQEWKGYGPAYKWFSDRSYSNSSGLQIIGQQIFIKTKGSYKLFPHPMSSLERVEQLQRQILRNAPRIHVDAEHPSAELNMNDPLWPGRFIRVAVWVPPRVWEGFTTITMRRQIVEYLSLEDQEGTGAIPSEAISALKHLINTYRNTIVAGQVDSGKSTFANTIVGEQLESARQSTGVIMIEKHPESILPYIVKGHRIIPIIAQNEELMNVGIDSLRHDPNIIFMTEMRYHEWEFYNYSGEKGHDGLIGTYHTTDPEDIPYQGAFAVYTRQGGSLKGHLISTLKACQLVFVMEPMKGGAKKLTKVSEIYYDPVKESVYANDLMRWDKDQSSWAYNDQFMSADLLEKMDRKNSEATKGLLSELTRLASIRRIQNPIKESMKAKMALKE